MTRLIDSVAQYNTRRAAKMQYNKLAADTMPIIGNVRANQCAAYLGIGLSTFWLYVGQKRIKEPKKYGVRVSVWDAGYIRQLRDDGIPAAQTAKKEV